MKKKDYQNTEMRVMLLQHQSHLLAGSVTGVESGDARMGFGGGNSGDARARQYNGGWDDDE